MDKYIFRTFDEVRQWVQDNRLSRYSFRAGRGEEKNNFIFTYDEDSTPEENLINLERRLEAHAGLHVYGVGWRKANTTVGGIVCEVQYGKDDDNISKIRNLINGGVGQPVQPSFDRDEMERSITERIELKYKLMRMEDDRKDFERERKEFNEEKNGVIGALVQYFAPVAQAMLQSKGLAKVAGTDVEAEKIVPVDNDEEEPVEGDLPDEEAQRAYELLCRFRQVEPDYLRLLESVVTMAEGGDQMYNTAKAFLLK